MEESAKLSSASKPLVPVLNAIALIVLGIAILVVAALLVLSLSGGRVAFDDEVVQEGSESEFVLADSDSRLYTREELESLSEWDMYIAHNEIFARHGRGFDREDLVEHFSSCSWYQELYSPEEFDAMPSQLNETEQANSDLMAEIRIEREDPTY